MPAIVIQSPQQTDTAALAEAAFEDAPSLHPETSYVCVGDSIDTDQQEGFLRCPDPEPTMHGHCLPDCWGYLVCSMCSGDMALRL